MLGKGAEKERKQVAITRAGAGVTEDKEINSQLWKVVISETVSNVVLVDSWVLRPILC